MRRLIALALLGAALALVPHAAGGPPPHAKAFGKSLTEWMKLYWTWALGGDQAGQVGRVLFLPIPEGELQPRDDDDPFIFVGEADVTLQPGTPFVLPVFTWVGETYVQDVPDDEPLPDEIFTNMEVLVTLDGRTLIDSDTDDLGDFLFGPVDFDDVILYDEPQPRGENLDAAGAIWVQGIGFVHHPLSVGRHTLTLDVFSDDFGVGFRNTWTITVRP
jgi:hypothetical protein